MKALRIALFALSLVATLVGTAAAQKVTTVGFEVDCNGAPTPGTFNGLTGLKAVSGALFAPCGVSSIVTVASGMQQLAQSGSGLVGNIRNVTGTIALAGESDFALLNSTTASIVITFSPPVNEVSFDALDLDNANGLTVSFVGVQGVAVPPDKPVAQDKTVHYARTSSTAIERMTISYESAFALLSSDGWFIDQLHFNAWICGDGELEAGAGEACDDGNTVQCDACNNKCQPSSAGCFDGTTCVANGVTVGCLVCNLAVPPAAGGDILVSPLPTGTACDDKLFCTVGDACDGLGTCKATPYSCNDSIACTVDTCDEISKSCLHPVEARSCLIANTCVASGVTNPESVCQVCAPETSSTAWSQKPAGAQCGDPSCSAGMQTAASTCDAMGLCTAGPKTACLAGTCGTPQSCDPLCTGDQTCAQQAHCLAGTMMCVPDLPAAAACTRGAECAGNFCADGVCCDKACAGACEACNHEGKAGTCAPLPALSVDPENRCTAGQYCSLEGQCTTPPPPPPPPPPVMMPTTPVPVDVRPLGTACDRNEVCGSALCKDGVCCDRACDGVCESCNAEGLPPGQCMPYPLGQDPDRECGGDGAVCAGNNACTQYETRGNGLCALTGRSFASASGSAGPQRADGATLGSLALAALGLLLGSRRARLQRRKRT